MTLGHTLFSLFEELRTEGPTCRERARLESMRAEVGKTR